MTRQAHFCSICGGALERQWHSGRERPYCRACDRPIYFDPKVAVVVFITRGDRLLLIRRAADPGKGKWALPAGFVDYDEAPEEAAIRETREETGLRVIIDGLLDVFPKRDDGLADIVIAYRATIAAGELQAGDDASEVGWYGREELPPLVFYPSITLANRWRADELPR